MFAHKETATSENLYALGVKLDGVNRRLDISNGRTAKLEQELDHIQKEKEKEHGNMRTQLSLISQKMDFETGKSAMWGKYGMKVLEWVTIFILASVFALIIK